jgi:hypothetical protein
MNSKRVFDLLISADWEYDRDFVTLLEEAARRENLAVYSCWPEHLSATIQKVAAGENEFRVLFDRASSSSPEFLELQNLLKSRGAEILEPIEQIRWASDKATMHLEFISHGINTPYTIIISPYETSEGLSLSPDDLAPLGRPFFIKPANTTGGSLGVIYGAETLEDVRKARRLYPQDKYLLQKKVRPHEEQGKRFWFRGFCILGAVLCAWWDDQTHIYTELTPEEVNRFNLQPLFPIVERIGEVSRLRFFSTEIVRTEEGEFLSVDYVNESCDMRLQSRHFDGVPDPIVHRIVDCIAGYIKKNASGSPF